MQIDTARDINKNFFEKFALNLAFWLSIELVYLLVSLYPKYLKLSDNSVGDPPLPIKYFDPTLLHAAVFAFAILFVFLLIIRSTKVFFFSQILKRTYNETAIKKGKDLIFHDEIVSLLLNAGSILGSTYCGAWISFFVNSPSKDAYAGYTSLASLSLAIFMFILSFFWNWISRSNAARADAACHCCVKNDEQC